MILFNELRITEDRKCLIVDCEVENIDLYSGMYIDSIYLEYYKNVPSTGMPSDKAYQMYHNDTEDTKVKAKRVSLSDIELAALDIGTDTFKDGLFYVIVCCGGSPSVAASTMPCGMDEDFAIGAILDWKTFYERGMQYVASMFSRCGNECELPVGFENFILVWNALKLAIAACDWDAVTDLWNNIVGVRSVDSGFGLIVNGSCGCGR